MDFRGSEHFAICRELGSGGMGVVYEAHDKRTNTRVALKTLRNIDAQGIYRLKKEFRALQDLQHPNLVQLGELVEHNGVWFFTMELLEGVNLLQYLRAEMSVDDSALTLPVVRRDQLKSTADFQAAAMADSTATFDEALLRDALQQLSSGVAALHMAERIHRDIKPTNIQVTSHGRVVLLDFGLAVESSSIKQSVDGHIFAGTPEYMAPEQAAGRAVTAAVDWYSVGVVLYQAMCGILPFTGAPFEVIHRKMTRPPMRPSERTSGIPDDLDKLCMDLLAIKPLERPNANEVMQRIGAKPRKAIPRFSSSSTGSSIFVGRKRELKQIREAFEQTYRGHTRSLFLSGQSGVGKSRLIRAFVDELAGSSCVVLQGACYERESVPYKALDGVIDDLSRFLKQLPPERVAELVPRNATLLPLIFPVLARVPAIAEAPEPLQSLKDSGELRKKVFLALRDLICRLAERRRVVVVVDNVQWADTDSLQLLTELLRPPEGPPLLLLLSSRGEFDQLDELQLPEQALPIRVKPLKPLLARELAQQLVNRAGLNDLLSPAVIAESADGHPMYIEELVRHASLKKTDEQPILKLDDAIWARVSTLDPTAIELIKLLALAGEPLDHNTVNAATEMEANEFERSVALLRFAHLVRRSNTHTMDRLEPYHDRVRKAVLLHLNDKEQLALHNKLANAMESSGTATEQPELLVRHMVAAGRKQRACRYALDGAERANKALAFARAAELYRTALSMNTLDEEERRRVNISFADALSHSGRGAEAADVFLAASAEADPKTRIECKRRATEHLLASGYIERGMSVLRSLLELVGHRYPRTPFSALWSLLRQRARLRLRGYGYDSRHESEIPARELARSDVLRTAASMLGTVDIIPAQHFQAAGLLLDLKLGEKNRALESLLYEVSFLGSAGGRALVRARRLWEQIAEETEQCGDVRLQAIGVGTEGVLNYFESRFSNANQLLEKAEQLYLFQMVGEWGQMGILRSFRVFTLRHLGDMPKLRKLFHEYLRDANRRGDRYASTTMNRVCNLAWLIDDRPDEARAQLNSTTWVAPSGTYHFQHYWEFLAEIELDLYQGQASGGLQRYAEQIQKFSRSLLIRSVEIVRLEYRWLVARLALAQAESEADPRRSLARARKLANKIAREKAGYGYVWAALLFAGVDACLGRKDPAIAQLKQVVSLAKRYDMRFLGAAARFRLADLLEGQKARLMRDEADFWMKSLTVKKPERLVDTVAPGFSRRKS